MSQGQQSSLTMERRVLLAFGLTTLIGIVLVGAALSYVLERAALGRARTGIAGRARLLAQLTDNEMIEARLDLEFLARLPAFQQFPHAAQIDPAIRGVPANVEMEKRQLLDELLRYTERFSVPYVALPNGDLYLLEPFELQTQLTRTNIVDRPYYQEALRTKRPVVSDSYLGADGRLGVTILVPILDAAGDPRAYLCSFVHLTKLSRLLARERITPFDLGFIVDRRNQLTAHTDTRMLAEQARQRFARGPFVSKAARQAAGASEDAPTGHVGECVDPATGKWYITAWMPLRSGWLLGLMRDRAGILAEARSMVWPITLLTSVLFFMVSAVGVAAAHRMGRHWDAAERALRASEERLSHLNAVLKAIRNTNQLIVRETDRQRLIQGACQSLVETRGYHSAWIMLLENHEPTLGASSGITEGFGQLRARFARGMPPECARRALAAPGVQVVRVSATECGDCPFAAAYRDRAGMAVQLASGGRTFGLLYISVPVAFADDEEERSLLREVADDIALALRGTEHQAERRRAEEVLRASQREIEATNRVHNIFLTVPDEQMYADVLTIILDVMRSKFGVFGYIDEEGSFIVPTMTRMVWDKCQVPDKQFVFPRAAWGNSSWPRAIREKRTICANEPSTLIPEGHIAISRHISLPLIHRGEVVGLLLVANKETDYCAEDLELLKTIGNVIAPVLDARLQRDRQEKARARADQELRARTAELEAANKELEAFSYSVSHDLRAPVRAVDGYGRILVEDYAEHLDQEGRRVLGVISSETKRMGQLIDDLLAFSRLGRQPLEPFSIDMTALAKAVFAELAAQAPLRAVRFECQPLPPAHGDRALLRVVWANLLSNALKFTQPREPALINIGSRQQDGQTVYYVSDNGVGFDMKYGDKLFGVFQRLHSAEEFDGTGVGLALVQRVIHRHGGRVWAEGKVNQGATFYFWLPDKKGQP